MEKTPQDFWTRREFLKTTASATLAAAIPGHLGLHAAGSDTVKIGILGCGGRGTGAALDAIKGAAGVEVVALYDAFRDRVDSSLKRLKDAAPGMVKVTDSTCFTGLDGYRGLLALPEVNYVILAAPPGFRPLHYQAAVEAGKNIFTEKPVAVDPVGIRKFMAASDLAK